MSAIQAKVDSIIDTNRHLSAVQLQHHIWNLLLVLVPVGKIQAQLEIARAKAHNAGHVTPR